MPERRQWFPCCACCDDPVAEGGPKSACCFNGERDRHTWPCEECEEACPCCGDVHPKAAAK